MKINFTDSDKLRLLSKCEEQEDGCWIWTAGKFGSGYGMFNMWNDGHQLTLRAHRASYAMFVEPIEDGLMILHSCHRPDCVRPSHLRAGTHQENMKDRDEAGHTSKGEHRYNFKQTDDLKEKVKQMRLEGYGVKSIMEATGIGYQTYYRIRKSMDDFPKEHRKFRK